MFSPGRRPVVAGRADPRAERRLARHLVGELAGVGHRHVVRVGRAVELAAAPERRQAVRGPLGLIWLKSALAMSACSGSSSRAAGAGRSCDRRRTAGLLGRRLSTCWRSPPPAFGARWRRRDGGRRRRAGAGSAAGGTTIGGRRGADAVGHASAATWGRLGAWRSVARRAERCRGDGGRSADRAGRGSRPGSWRSMGSRLPWADDDGERGGGDGDAAGGHGGSPCRFFHFSSSGSAWRGIGESRRVRGPPGSSLYTDLHSTEIAADL